MNAAAPGRLYGRRKGKRLRPQQATLLHDFLPRVAISVPAPGAMLDPAHAFDRAVQAVWLEIGFGGGEHLATLAASHPEIGFIGCEPFVNGIVKLLASIARDGLGNVRVQPDDARPLIAALRPGSIGRVFILFPDPWPKVRHHKRRIVEPGNLDALAKAMAPSAELRLATDDVEYALWMLDHVGRHPDFEGPAADASLADFAERPSDWPATRYEAKALAAGRKPAYFRYRRRLTPGSAPG